MELHDQAQATLNRSTYCAGCPKSRLADATVRRHPKWRKLGIPFTAPEGRGTPVWWTPLDTRSLDLITRARFRRWTNASVTTRPAASTSVVCAGLRDSPAPIAERRGSHG